MKTPSYLEADCQKNNDIVQVFRGLAIVAVVMIHTTPLGLYQVFCRPFINFGVATFLFLSGYLTNIEKKDWLSFYKKRIIRIVIPYIIWTTLYTIPRILHGEGLILLPTNILTAQAAPQLYYCFVYIQFVLLTPLLGQLARSRYKHLGCCVTLFSVLIFKYYPLLTGNSLNHFWSVFWDDTCLGWFTYYYLGLLLGNHIFEKKYSTKTLVFLFAISLFIQMGEAYGWHFLGEINCGTQYKLSSILSNSLFCLIVYTILSDKQTLTNKIYIRSLKLLGDYSFGIFLCHIFIMDIFFTNQFYNALPYPINSLVIIILSLLCCWGGVQNVGCEDWQMDRTPLSCII